MAAITTRATAGGGATVKGSPLTNAELDTNFININTDLSNAAYTTGSYSNPAWITSLSETKVLPTQTGNSGKYLTTDGTSTSWATVSLPAGQTAGSTTSGYLQYAGTTKTDGQLYGGTTSPTNTTRLNYDGHFYATKLFGDGTGLTGITLLTTAQTFTAAQTFRAANSIRAEAAATQDAIVLAGRAGGNGSFAVTLTPATLAANRTLTLPDVTGTILTTGAAVTVAQGGTGITTGTTGGIPYFNSTSTIASSAALAANALVVGGGAAAPSTVTTGAGILTFLGTPSSANLAAAITDETGSGSLVFATSPTLVTPVLGAATATSITASSTISGTSVTATSTAANTSYIVGTSYSVTGANTTAMIDLSGTWNTTGVATLLKANVTNTASGSGSKLIDLQTGGTTRFSVDTTGNTTLLGSVLVPVGTQTAPSYSVTGDTNTGIFFPAADTFAITTNGTEKVRINSNGNLGIGTLAPDEKLVVAGAITASGQAAANKTSAGTFDFYATDNATRILSWGSSGVGGAVSFWTGSGGSGTTEKMRLDSSGRLLVNTTGTSGTAGQIEQFQIYGTGSAASSIGLFGISDTTPANVRQYRARAALTSVQAGDFLGANAFFGYTNAWQIAAVRLIGVADTVSTNLIGGKLEVRTTDSSGTEGTRLTIGPTGAITSSDLADAVGYKGTPINSQSAAYTLVMADQGKTILHPSSDNNARTFTIPANSSVAFPVGTVITFINRINTVTIAITTDTMYLAGDGTTGSRTLAAYGMASAVKITTTEWMISGNGLT